MAASEQTKKYKKLSLTFLLLSIALLSVPLIVYVIIGFVNGDIGEKMTLGCTVVIAAIMTGLNILMKWHIRSTIWVVVLGIYFAVDNILPLLLMVASATIIDEFVLTPLHKKYKQKAVINKEIDARNG